MPADQVREALAQIGAGLAFAHGLGIVHRDLKPANVLVSEEGTLKLADFGIGALVGPEGTAQTLTGHSTLGGSGTPVYQDERRLFAPPAPVDDVYALGVIGVQLLLGDLHRRLPYDWPEDLAEIGAPEDLVALLRKCLGRAERRPQDGAAFLEDLGQPARRTPAPEPTPKPAAAPLKPRWEPLSRFRDPLRSGGQGPEMVVIPAGRFVMGSAAPQYENTGLFGLGGKKLIAEGEEGRGDDEGPRREVRFARSFALGRNVVTFAEYEAYCKAAGTEKPDDAGWGRGRRPVIKVSCEDAAGYCAWLSAETGVEYRLPSEAEWEYACRAGTETPFFFGETISTDQANYNGNFTYGPGVEGEYRERTVPVDEMPLAENAWGLRHLHGNVWEWCADAWNASYEGAPCDGSVWQTGDTSLAVLRGGSWNYSPGWLRSANRVRYWPDVRNYNVGFRLARTLPD
ncbi:MAG: SUMF1/EgtB/PvdO family nonheme iron enzyme [Pseudomonadota bacterium]